MGFDLIDRKFKRPVCEPVEPPSDRPDHWWCDKCADCIPASAVIHFESCDVHAVERGGCGSADVVPYCETCESGGWVQVYSQHPPCFGVCETCLNPFDYSSP